MKEDSTTSFSPFKIAVLTSLGYWAADLAFYPLDTVATRLRAGRPGRTAVSHCRQIFGGEGWRLFFKGASLTLFTSFVPSVIYFSVYQNLMHGAKRTVDNLSLYTGKQLDPLKLAFPFFASCLAELTSLLVLVPFDTVRTRLQSGQYKSKSLPRAVCSLVRKEGWLRLFGSGKFYAVNNLLFSGIEFQMLETFRYVSQRQSVWLMLLATTIATVLTGPVDFLTTRRVLFSQGEATTMLGLARGHFKEAGLAGMMRGTLPKLGVNLGYSLAWYPIYSSLRASGWDQNSN